MDVTSLHSRPYPGLSVIFGRIVLRKGRSHATLLSNRRSPEIKQKKCGGRESRWFPL